MSEADSIPTRADSPPSALATEPPVADSPPAREERATRSRRVSTIVEWIAVIGGALVVALVIGLSDDRPSTPAPVVIPAAPAIGITEIPTVAGSGPQAAGASDTVEINVTDAPPKARLYYDGMLVTQNPVDIDYKALSNCGTWLLGKMQTEQDKARILDGLDGTTRRFRRPECV